MYVLLLALWFAAAELLAAAGNGKFERVRALIRTELVERQVPSVAVAVARDGKILWEEGFGWADRESRVPATEHTMYSLASVSKPVTATALMVLKERGKIDLDRPINDYLGEAKLQGRAGDAAGATLRRVANHTAGLPLHYHFFYEDEPYRPPTMDETIRRYGNLVTAPGERYQYSNLGYGVLDYVISRVSGKSYEDFLRVEVFLPLGMTRSSVGVGPGLGNHHAIRYGTDGLRIPFYDFDHRGGSAVYASAHDLARFGLFHLKARLGDQKPILSDQSIDDMQKPTAWQSKLFGYSIGWATSDLPPARQISHSGGMGGVSTLLTLLPSEKLAVVVLSNFSSNLPGRIAQEILATLRPAPPPRRPEPEPPVPFKPPPELLGPWGGSVHTYKGELPL